MSLWQTQLPVPIVVVALTVALMTMPSNAAEEERRILQYAVPDDNAVLVLVADKNLQRLMLEVLSVEQRVTIAYTAREAVVLVGAFRYRLVILSNFGMSPEHAVSVVPKDHSYPVIFISGVYDQDLRRICQEKLLRCMGAPFEIEALRRAVAEEIGEQSVPRPNR